MIQNLYLLLGASPTGDGAATSGGGIASLLPFILIFVVMYFLMIRPQSKKRKQMTEMLKNIQKGDKVITAGGIHGTVSSTFEKTVTIKVDDNTKITFNKDSIATVINEEAKQQQAKKKEEADKDTQKEIIDKSDKQKETKKEKK